MALDVNKIRNKQLETSKSAGNFFKCSAGKNLIRVFKFRHEVTKDDVTRGYFKKEEIGKEVEELDRPVTLHYNYSADSKKPVVSNRKIMSEYKALASSSSDEDVRRAEEIKPSKKYFLNIVDVNNVDKGVKIFGATKGIYNAILEILMDPEYGGENAIFGHKGLDFGIIYDPNAAPANMYKVLPRAAGNSEVLSKDLEKQLMDLYDPKNLSLFGAVLSEDEPEAAEPEAEAEAEEKPKEKAKDEVDDWLSAKPKAKREEKSKSGKKR